MEEDFELKWDGQYIATSREYGISAADPSKRKAIRMLQAAIEREKEAIEEHIKHYSDKPRIQPWLDIFEEKLLPRLLSGEINACAFVAMSKDAAYPYPEVYYWADGPPICLPMMLVEAAHIIRRKEGT
jgi:hypothetical protein